MIVQGSLDREMLLLMNTSSMSGNLSAELGKWIGSQGSLTENWKEARRLNKMLLF